MEGDEMARSDLLVALVKAGSSGDKKGVRAAAEAIIAEERAKQHNVLADRLETIVQINGSGSGPKMVAGSSYDRGREFIAEVTPRHRLEDLVLSDDCRRNVDQLIEEQQRASLLHAHGIDPRHRALLIGPPGNGKTSLAEAIAEALAIPFFVVRYEAMIESYLGETATRLKRVFDYARTTPCVLFFDEFDAVGKERGDIHETGEIKRVVTSLLMQVDDLPSYTIVIAATNHAELLDRAVWRRFQLRLSLPAPTTRVLGCYFERFLKSVDGGRGVGISGETIAKRLGRISFAEAEDFVLDIRRRSVLSLGKSTIKGMVEQQLKLLEHRARPQNMKKTEGRNGGSSASGTTEVN
jgi:SpoVK/Ycf46/Vps4 family AAA+-type ATPase